MGFIGLPPAWQATAAANDVATRTRDVGLQRALEAMRARPAERWTVARLAKIAGLSRAAFARHFAADVGLPPLHLLRLLRVGRAAELLAASDVGIAAIAAEVGYSTEFALSRAFHRYMGEPPGTYRRRVGAAGRLAPPRCLAA